MAWDLSKGRIGFFPYMETGAVRRKNEAELEEYLQYLEKHLYEIRNGEDRHRYKPSYSQGLQDEQRRIKTIITTRKRRAAHA